MTKVMSFSVISSKLFRDHTIHETCNFCYIIIVIKENMPFQNNLLVFTVFD